MFSPSLTWVYILLFFWSLIKNDKLLHLPTAEVYLEMYDTRHGGVDVVFVGPRKGWKSWHCFGSAVFLNTAILHTVRITQSHRISHRLFWTQQCGPYCLYVKHDKWLQIYKKKVELSVLPFMKTIVWGLQKLDYSGFKFACGEQTLRVCNTLHQLLTQHILFWSQISWILFRTWQWNCEWLTEF